MSSLALLIGADPKVSKGGPVVRLQSGQYIFRVEGQVDSDLIFHAINYPTSNGVGNGMLLTVLEPMDIRITFSERGTEKHINVFAEKIL